MLGAMTAPTVVLRDADGCIGRWRNALIVTVTGETKLEGVRAIGTALAALREQHRAGVVLVVVAKGAPMPSADIRAAMAEPFVEHADVIAGYAAVHEGSGFAAAAVRGVVTSMMMVKRLPYEHRVFARVDEAALWLGSKAANVFSAGELVAVVEQLRSASPGVASAT